MDKDRQIRFLYPPLIFLSSLILGIWIDPSPLLRNQISSFFQSENNTSVVAALLGVGSLVLVLGFLLGTITVIILRTLFFKNRCNYEFLMSEESYRKIGELIFKKSTDRVHKKDRLYAVVVYDHSRIDENVHRWIIRRWNAFFIAASSIVALAFSLIIGSNFLSIALTNKWWITVSIFIILFLLQGYSSWIETMRMISFMTRVETNKLPEEQGPEEE